MKPVASMTGFAVASRPTVIGPVTVELKSVNSRFLDLSVRYPDELRSVEPALREAISARVNRGKMECRLAVSRVAGEASGGVNTAALGRLKQLAAEVVAVLPFASPLTTADVLGWPGVVDAPVADPDALRVAVLEALAEALDALAASRQREGSALRDVLHAHCNSIDVIGAQVKARAPGAARGGRAQTGRTAGAGPRPRAGRHFDADPRGGRRPHPSGSHALRPAHGRRRGTQATDDARRRSAPGPATPADRSGGASTS